jgi:hypothetical protein
MKLTNWFNDFHKTKANSTLSMDDYLEIQNKVITNSISSQDKDYRRFKELREKLCPHEFNCCACDQHMRTKKRGD